MKNPDSRFALGIIIGTAIGIATKNVGLWLALGVVFGAALHAAALKEQKKNNNNGQENDQAQK